MIQRKPYDENRALSLGGFYRNGTALFLDDSSAQIESHTGAFRLFYERMAAAIETLKDFIIETS